ncbi:MAG: alanine--glyoxylate aminotransferase family protein [Candidatus Eremiobacteraeota bacterium]|nr:alanine--glyoxylate aminotransferase family protein [Candidatus Eremiobacteraeota bacterium]
MKKTLLLLPGPVPVAVPVLEAMAHPMIDHRGPEFAEMLGRLGEGMQPIFGTSQDVLFLGSSGTGALEAAVVNLFSPGDVVLSCPLGIFGKRLAAIAAAYGCIVETLEVPLGCGVDVAALAARLRDESGRTIRGVLLTHNETSTGVQCDMAAISRAIADHGALSVVDSVSGLGASEFKMDEWGFDVVVTASQKALAVPPGLAMVAVSERAWKAIEGARIPRFYFDLVKAREFSRKGQTAWTPPISIFFALAVALERYHAGGMRAQFERHARYARAIRGAFRALAFSIFSRDGAHSDTVVAAVPPTGIDAAALLRTLRETYGVVLSGGQGELAGKIVRFGTMGDIQEFDILAAVGTLELALSEAGSPVNFGSGISAAAHELRGGH